MNERLPIAQSKKLFFPIKYLIALAIILLLLISGGYFYYQHITASIDNNYQNSLKQIAQSQNTKIDNWHANWVSKLNTIITDSSIIRFLSLNDKNPSFKILQHNIEVHLKNYLDDENISSIDIRNGYGEIVYSAGVKISEPNIIINSGFNKESLGLKLDSCYFLIGDNKVIRFVISLPIDRDSNIGSIYAELNTDVALGSNSNNLIIKNNSDIDLSFIKNSNVQSIRDLIYKLDYYTEYEKPEAVLEIASLVGLKNNEGIIRFKNFEDNKQQAYIIANPKTGWIITARDKNKESYTYLIKNLTDYLVYGLSSLLLASVILLMLWRKTSTLYTTAVKLDNKHDELLERFNHFNNFSKEIIFVLNKTGRIIEFNENAFKTYGYTVEEFNELNICDLRISKDRNKTDEFFDNLELNGLIFDTTHRKKDRTEFEVEVSLKRISANGKTYIQNIVRDISQRKLLEKQIKENEQIFDLIVNNLDEVVFIFSITPERKFQFISKSIFNLIGLTNEQVLKDPSLLIKNIHPEERHKLKQLIEGNLELDAPPIRFLNDKEETVYVKVRSITQKDSNNNPIAIIGLLQNVTEQINSELALRKNEESLRYLFDNNPLPMWLYNFDSKIILEINNAALKHYGYSKDEFLSLKVSDILNPDEISTYNDYEMIEIIKSNQPIETTHILKNGKIINVELNSRLIQLNGSSENVVLEVIQDITERKEVEAKIKESEQRFKTLAKISPVAIFRTNSRGELTYVNENWTEMAGIFPEIAFGKKWWEGLPIQDKDLVEQRWKRSTFVSSNFESELQILNPKSVVKNVLAGIVKITSGDDKVMGYVGTLTDITKMKLFEVNFRKLYHSVDQSPVSVVITDRLGNIEFVNPAVIKSTGYSKEELLGNNPRILKSGKQNPAFYKNLWEKISSGKIWQGEFNNKRKDGSFYWEQASISPVLNERKEIINYVAVKEDITDRKILHDELIKAKTDAVESNRLKANFLTKINHELRTPLLSIMGSSHSVLNDAENIRMKELGEILVKESDRLNSSLKSILSLSSLESENQNYALEPIDISYIIKNVYNQYKHLANDRGLNFVIEDILDRIFVIGNKEMIHEIVSNLIDNAIKFTEKGSVIIFNEYSDDSYILSIKDTGAGISDQSKEIIFEPFRQAETQSSNVSGIGLGLTLAKKFAEVMGGKISFESTLYQGTTFCLHLNLVKDEDKPEIITEVLTPITEDKVVGETRKKMLIVEDDEINLKITKAYLKKLFDISSAENSKIALEKVAEQKFDIILMDIGLKDGLNGMELTSILREMPEYSTIPIIAVTAFTLAKDKEDIMNSGCSSYLSKPFTKEELINTISGALAEKV